MGLGSPAMLGVDNYSQAYVDAEADFVTLADACCAAIEATYR